MNLNQLKYFRTLARYEHYTKASKELFISQPSLTHSIKELENELGVILFSKEGRNVKLTAEGKIFLEYTNKCLDILNRGINDVRNYNKDSLEVVDIGVIPTMFNTYLAPIIKEITNQYPNLKIRFRCEKTLDIIQGVQSNKYDFGICSKIEHSNLTYLPLLYEELVLIVRQNHPLTKLKEVTLKDIIAYPLITYQKEISIYDTIMKLFENHELRPQIAYQLDDESSIASMVSLDFGVAIVADNELLKPFSNLKKIPLEINQDLRIVYLVYNPQLTLSNTAKKFIDYIIKNDLKI